MSNPTLSLALLLVATFGAACARAADPGLDAALFEAIVYHEDAQVRDLLRRGARADAVNADGVAAIELAVREAAASAAAPETLAVVERLIEAGARLDRSIDDDHPHPILATAIRAHLPPLVELLLRRGADPNQVDGDGAVPLHAAIDQDDPELVRLLLAHGADRGFRSEEGTVLDYARGHGASDEVVALLR